MWSEDPFHILSETFALIHGGTISTATAWKGPAAIPATPRLVLLSRWTLNNRIQQELSGITLVEYCNRLQILKIHSATNTFFYLWREEICRCKNSFAMTIKWRKYTGLTHISVSFPWELHFYNSFRMWEGKHKRGGKYSRYFWQKLQFCGCMLALFQPGWYQGEDEVGIWNLVEIACVWMICMRIV